MKYVFAIAPLLALAACNSPTAEQVEANAITAEGDARYDAEQRADNLDKLGEQLEGEANAASGANATALRDRADADYDDAAAVRAAGDATVDNIESKTDAELKK